MSMPVIVLANTSRLSMAEICRLFAAYTLAFRVYPGQ